MSTASTIALIAETVIFIFGVIFAIQFSVTAHWWRSFLGIHIFSLNAALILITGTALARHADLLPINTSRPLIVGGLVLVALLMVAQVPLQAVIHVRGERRRATRGKHATNVRR